MNWNFALVAAPALLLFAGCDRLSDVGNLGEPAPRASASTLGWPYTVESPELITATVRSGGDVLLSGKNSQKGADDTGVPLIRFDWEQISGPQVDLVYRTASTVYFTAPADLPDDAELRFRLTVHDAKGNSDSTEARVLVRDVPDADHFLHYLGVPTTVSVTVATAIANLNPGMADTPVTVTMTKLVSFTDRLGKPHMDVPVTGVRPTGSPPGRDLSRSTAWTGLHGGSTSCASPVNPSVDLPLPRLDMDDVLLQPLADFPEAVTLGDVMEPSDVDLARVQFRLDAVATGVTPALCIGGTKFPNGQTWSADDATLIPAAQPWDSKSDADAYYRSIGAEATLEQWLASNGMDSSLPKWGADAHAVYTNNFDLGFGRNMYMKTGACDAGFNKAMPVQQRVGKCDVAAVVVNYADLEAAARRTSPVIAVAMEYSRVGTTGERFTKFFVYAPHHASGEWRLVRSANLDGRGEQYVPGTCTVCHGGVPATQAITSNGPYPGVAGAGAGNINASFLPWDLDALLFSDTDPGFSKRSRDAALKDGYTEAVQREELKALNLGAYSTWSDPAGQGGRFALARELVGLWYGSDLDSATFNSVKGACANDSCVPDSWKSGGSQQNPAGSADMYRQVFASNCRACHVNQVPETAAGSSGVSDPRDWASCNGSQAPTNPGHQVPMACYWQFAKAPRIATRLSANEMPFARRTSDQFWLPGDSSTGQILLGHLGANGTTVSPPARQPCIDAVGSATTDGAGASKFEVQRNAWIDLTSGCSRFLTNPVWQVTAQDGSPVGAVATAAAGARILSSRQGDYHLALSQAGANPVTRDIWVRPLAPNAADATITMGLDPGGSAQQTVNFTTLPNFSSRDPVVGVEIESFSGLTYDQQTSNSVRLVVNALGTGKTLRYRLVDSDGDRSNPATITVNVTSTLTANGFAATIATNGSGSIPLASHVSNPTGQSLTYGIETPPSMKRPGRAIGTATIAGTAVNYVAPAGVTSHYAGTQISTDTDWFNYKVCFASQPTVCSIAKVDVQLAGTKPVGEVIAILKTVTSPPSSGSVSMCAGCHVGGTGAGYNEGYDLRSTVSNHDVYCQLRTLTSVAGVPGTEAAGTPYLDLATPSSSLLYRKPKGEEGHSGGALVGTGKPISTVDWDAKVLGWINEGAYWTESNQQSCP